MLTTQAPSRSAVRRLAIGRLISITGSYAASIALSYAVYRRTGSAAWVAVTMLATFGVVGFFSPVGGMLSDRLDRRLVMVISEVGAGLGWALIAVIDEVGALLLVALISSVLESFFFPASGAAIPNVAGREDLSWANSLIAVGRYAGLTFGPLVGGAIFVVAGPGWVYVLNAFSFLLSGLLVLSVRGSFSDPAPSDEGVDYGGFAAGFRFIASERVLKSMLLSWVVFVLGTATTAVAEPVLAGNFETGAVGYGFLTAAWGGGTIIGAWVSRGVREDREASWIVGFSAVMALTCLGVAISPWFWLIVVWIAIFGLADGPTQVVEQNLLQRLTPDRIRGRVMGAWEAVMQAALVAALLLGGVIVSWLGPRGSFAFAGVMGLAGSALLTPLLRWLPSPVRRSTTPNDAIVRTP